MEMPPRTRVPNRHPIPATRRRIANKMASLAKKKERTPPTGAAAGAGSLVEVAGIPEVAAGSQAVAAGIPAGGVGSILVVRRAGGPDGSFAI